MDLAAASWALKAPGRWGFYEGYVAFRQETPIIGHILLFLLLLLPLALWQLISEDLVGLWKRPAHRRRHIAGTANLVGLIVAISWAIAGVKPAEKTALEVLGAASSDEAARAAAAGGVWQAHLVNVGINLFMAVSAGGGGGAVLPPGPIDPARPSGVGDASQQSPRARTTLSRGRNLLLLCGWPADDALLEARGRCGVHQRGAAGDAAGGRQEGRIEGAARAVRGCRQRAGGCRCGG